MKSNLIESNFVFHSDTDAAGGAAVIASKSVSADTKSFGNKTGYRETELVKTYYLSTRF